MSRTARAVIAVVVAAAVVAVGAPMLVMVMVLQPAAVAASGQACGPAVVAMGAASGPVRVPVVAPYQITSEFGMRSNPGQINHGQVRLHAGIDFAYVGAPTTVVAVMAGVVKSTPTSSTGGNMVFIDHGSGIETRYLHLSSRSVSVGDQVAAGTPVGVEGSTGNSTGPHLHFEVAIAGAQTDPRAWFATQGVTLPPLRSTATPPAASAPGPSVITAGVAMPGQPMPTDLAPRPLVEGMPQAVGAWSGEQLVNAGHIINAGQAMGLDARTITIGVMTAMGESTLKNIGYGDAVGPDSRGLFQQRANGAWGTLADRMNPTTAATNFFRALTRVPGYQSMEPTLAAHAAQRNADPFHYRPYWADAVAVVSALTGDPSLLASLPAAGTLAGCATQTAYNGGATGTGNAIVEAASAHLGLPYSWGGGTLEGPSTGTYTSPSLNGTGTVGFDCSGLTRYAVYQATGITLAHSADKQARDTQGTPVARDFAQMQAGDVIAFSRDGGAHFDHVGIYAGGGRMIHANRPGVPLENIDLAASPYFMNQTWVVHRYATTA